MQFVWLDHQTRQIIFTSYDFNDAYAATHSTLTTADIEIEKQVNQMFFLVSDAHHSHSLLQLSGRGQLETHEFNYQLPDDLPR